ncbi:terminase small subunit [Listeria phage LP-KV022]|uniref:Terminase small subunit n=6 Tax=Homburgvirus TaxID=1921125 RepID=A0A5A4K1E0_9CAUD|nr:terminase small subunit [Listeria phage LP-110]YP_009045152.1 terminase small subunit [Listeria phage LP-114]AWY07643.1 terminase small subunit [Listeria phage LP-KV022]QDK04617.1 hypothetical protein FK481_0103 [Listeria phage LP-010]QDK04728.1 hypothetical protein FK482_0106 [Listeria phage LP-013]QDK04841.1 hypothetical protein FK484_0108 [Listeria phage LP-031]AGI11564.1 terminase small subunit [Listeria phage LP-110]
MALNIYNDPEKFSVIKPKTKRLLREYLVDHNVSRAARESGYTRPYAHTLLSKEENQAYLRYVTESNANSTIADQKDILEYYTRVVKGEEGEEFVTAKGEKVNKKPSIVDKNKAAEMLGKSYGMWKEKQEIKVETVITVDIVGDDEDEDDEDDWQDNFDYSIEEGED